MRSPFNYRFGMRSPFYDNETGFSPAALFALAEPGAWYDPSDLTTLFQDSGGATPVTAPNQQVGLMLDKSQGPIGPELVSNGTFVGNATTGWYRGFVSTNGTFIASGGFATYTVGASDGSSPRMVTAIPNLVVGKTYKLFFTEGTATGTGDRSVEWTSTADGTGGTTLNRVTVANWNGENKSFLVAATATTMYLAFSFPSTSSGSTGSIGNVSVKSAFGTHATQATSTQRPIYGINPITGTRNLLTYTEQFDNAAWSKFGTVTVTPNNTVAPDGTTTADKVAISTSSGIFQAITALPLTTYTASVWVRADSNVTSRLVVNTNLGDAVFLTINATTTWQRVSLSKTTTAWTNTVTFQIDGGNGANTIYLWGAQVEQSATATAYQKVVTQYEVTQAGVQSVSYLRFDGVDDNMVTGTITPGIDKVQVFAGVRKLSDALVTNLAELSSTAGTNAGVFRFSAPGGTPGAANYSFGSRGSATITTAVALTYTAPITNVVTGLGDISGDTATIRVNGVQVAQSTTDQGTGNYLAYPLYIGSRAGTSVFFNGRLYSMIVRFGSNLPSPQITDTENYVNSKTGAY